MKNVLKVKVQHTVNSKILLPNSAAYDYYKKKLHNVKVEEKHDVKLKEIKIQKPGDEEGKACIK